MDLLATVSLLPIIALYIRPDIVLGNEYYIYYVNIQDVRGATIFILSISLSFFLGKFVLSTLRVKSNGRIIANLICSVEEHLVQNLLSANIRKFNSSTKGRWERFISSGGGQTVSSFMHATLNLFSDFIVLLVFLVVGWVVIGDLILFLTFVGFCVLLINSSNFNRKLTFISRKNNQSRRETYLSKISRGWAEVRLYNIEKRVFELFRQSNRVQKYTEARLESARIMGPHILELIFFSMVAISVSSMTFYSNFMSVENVGLIAMVTFRLLPLLNRISTNINQVRQGFPRIDFVLKFFEQSENLRVAPTCPDYGLAEYKGAPFLKELKLVELCYVHHGQKSRTLDDINVTIKKGDFCLISGPSGSGKTTLSTILCGLREPTRGRYTVDEKVVTASTVKYMKNLLAYVPAAPFLFDGTLLENITFFDSLDDVNSDNLEQALEYCSLFPFIEKKNKGIYTEIKVDEDNLSTGEKQRISLARALYKNPDIYIFDEPTANLNREYESAFFKFFEEVHLDSTVILITHKKNVFKRKSRNFRLENSKLVETGL